MKCDDCLNLLEEYIDGEAIPRDAEQVSAHLITCARCAHEFEAVTAEQEIYARYDRELEISPTMWNAIAARTAAEHTASATTWRSALGEWFAGLLTVPRFGLAFSGAVAVLVAAIVVGIVYLRTHQSEQKPQLVARTKDVETVTPRSNTSEVTSPPTSETKRPVTPPRGIQAKTSKLNQQTHKKSIAGDQSDVLFTDAAYTDIEDRDTASHLEQAQDLLLSFRNIKFSDDDEEVDVSYEKAESRRLLNENVVLRRDAEMAGKFPAKSVLGSLEPFLIDIANLPDKAPPRELRQIKDRVQKTEIVAELRGY